SLISILSGLTDWTHTFGEEKRTGMLHGLIMVVATVAFVVSILVRANGHDDQRMAAMVLSGFGWLVMLIGAFFGGEMAYGYGTEVNRQAWSEHPTKWQKLEISATSLEDRKPKVAKTKGGTDVLVVKLDEKLYAIGAKCTHAGGPLAEGKWVGKHRRHLQCPWHQSAFCVPAGNVTQGP